jgi:hypothetical protein
MTPFDKPKQDFGRNVESVHELVNFDRYVMEFAIERVEGLHRRLAARDTNPMTNGEHALTALKNVRQNDSLRRNYAVIANQALVLLVSYFGSAVADIFRAAVPMAHAQRVSEKLRNEDLKLSLDELVRYASEPESIGELFAAKKDISFQDMQSIVRAFDDYIDVKLLRDVTVNNIVLGQACRHVIVHSGGVADRRCVHQLVSAKPRTLKLEIKVGDQIQFDTNELDSVAADMQSFIERLAAMVSKRLEAPSATTAGA